MGLIKYIGKIIDKLDTAYAKAIDEGGSAYKQMLMAQAMLDYGELELAIPPIFLLPQEPKSESEPTKIAEGIEEILQEE